jgi:hypothetical protein
MLCFEICIVSLLMSFQTTSIESVILYMSLSFCVEACWTLTNMIYMIGNTLRSNIRYAFRYQEDSGIQKYHHREKRE